MILYVLIFVYVVVGVCVCVCVYCAMQYVIIMRCFSLIVPPVSAMIAWQREWGT